MASSMNAAGLQSGTYTFNRRSPSTFNSTLNISASNQSINQPSGLSFLVQQTETSTKGTGGFTASNSGTSSVINVPIDDTESVSSKKVVVKTIETKDGKVDNKTINKKTKDGKAKVIDQL